MILGKRTFSKQSKQSISWIPGSFSWESQGWWATCASTSSAFCDSSKVPVLELPSGPLVVSWHPVLGLGFNLSCCIFWSAILLVLPANHNHRYTQRMVGRVQDSESGRVQNVLINFAFPLAHARSLHGSSWGNSGNFHCKESLQLYTNMWWTVTVCSFLGTTMCMMVSLMWYFHAAASKIASS